MNFIGIVSLADLVLLTANPVIHCVFGISRRSDILDKTFFAISKRHPLYIFHFSLIYLLLLMTIVLLARKMAASPRIYKLKYASIMLAMCIVMAGHALYLNLSFSFDYSVILYTAIALTVFYFSVIYIPRGLMEKLLLFTFANMEDGIVCMDADGNIAHYNQKAVDYCGGAESSDLAENIAKWFSTHPKAKDSDELTWREARTLNGEKRRFTNIYRRIYDKHGEYLGCFFTYHDRTDEYRRIAEEHYNASHDTLTGLFNAEYFCIEAEKLIEKNSKEDMLIVCTDVKNFKLINDFFSFDGGDKLLAHIAGLLSDTVGKNGICGRMSGDRFAVCIPKNKFREKSFSALNDELGTFYESDGFKVHMHFGVYEVTDRSIRVSLMCDRANLAIRTIKESYHKNIAYYESELMDSFITEQKLISQFEEALQSGQFVAFIQPQISADGKIFGGETLVRWLHPDKGFVPPAKFIGVFEQTGLISRLDRHMWELACMQLRKWRDEGLKNHYISVNISKKDFFLMDVAEVLISLTRRYDLDQRCLRLEITETAVMSDPKKQTAIIGNTAQNPPDGFVLNLLAYFPSSCTEIP